MKGPRLWLDSSNSNDVRSRVDKHKLEHSRSFKNTFAPGEMPEGLRRPVRPPFPPPPHHLYDAWVCTVGGLRSTPPLWFESGKRIPSKNKSGGIAEGGLGLRCPVENCKP